MIEELLKNNNYQVVMSGVKTRLYWLDYQWNVITRYRGKVLLLYVGSYLEKAIEAFKEHEDS